MKEDQKGTKKERYGSKSEKNTFSGQKTGRKCTFFGFGKTFG
jgi:hypothetical protein